jgi:hypothetical protein
MSPPDLARRLAARKLAAARLATELILDCERAAAGRNGKRADPARGVVALPCAERVVSPPQELSGHCDCGPPRVHRRGAERAVRLG